LFKIFKSFREDFQKITLS